jgi:hypothetical protein
MLGPRRIQSSASLKTRSIGDSSALEYTAIAPSSAPGLRPSELRRCPSSCPGPAPSYPGAASCQTIRVDAGSVHRPATPHCICRRRFAIRRRRRGSGRGTRESSEGASDSGDDATSSLGGALHLATTTRGPAKGPQIRATVPRLRRKLGRRARRRSSVARICYRSDRRRTVVDRLDSRAGRCAPSPREVVPDLSTLCPLPGDLSAGGAVGRLLFLGLLTPLPTNSLSQNCRLRQLYLLRDTPRSPRTAPAPQEDP